MERNRKKHMGDQLVRNAGFAILLCLFVITASVRISAEEVQSTETQLSEQAESGITKISARIISITGNQMTYLKLADLSDAGDEEETQAFREINEDSKEGTGERPGEVFEESTEESAGGIVRQNRRQKTDQTGDENSDGTGDGNTGETTGRGARRNREQADGQARRQNTDEDMMPDFGSRQGDGGFSRNTEAQEKVVYIPVSAPVYTDTGKEMTFTVLQAGDIITIQTELSENGEEIITGIWLTATE